MNKIFLSFGLLFILSGPVVSVKDFKPAIGKWTGTLTYLDYSGGKPYTMPANITVGKDVANTQRIIFYYDYPNEPKANGSDTLLISTGGAVFDGATVVSKERNGRVLRIVTDKNGLDGNDSKAAVIRHIYTIGKKIFSIRKEVKFDGEEKWITRNEYKMSR